MPKRCDMGVGCDEAGVCYAAAHGEPERCPLAEPPRDVRIVSCEACNTEGRIYRTRSGHPNDPDWIDLGPCDVCEGTGGMMIEVEPITLGDLVSETVAERVISTPSEECP